MARILLVEDDLAMLEFLSIAMRKQGHSVVAAPSAEQGLKKFSERRFDLVVSDIVMPDMDGLELIIQMRYEYPDTKVIAISGGPTAVGFGFLDAAKKLGAVETLQKPFSLAEFNALVDRCLGEGQRPATIRKPH